MNIHISDAATKQLEAVIGSADPAVIAEVVERFAENEQLILAAMLENPTEDELRESAAMCEQSMQNVRDGKTKAMRQALKDVANKAGVQLDR